MQTRRSARLRQPQNGSSSDSLNDTQPQQPQQPQEPRQPSPQEPELECFDDAPGLAPGAAGMKQQQQHQQQHQQNLSSSDQSAKVDDTAGGSAMADVDAAAALSAQQPAGCYPCTSTEDETVGEGPSSRRRSLLDANDCQCTGPKRQRVQVYELDQINLPLQVFSDASHLPKPFWSVDEDDISNSQWAVEYIEDHYQYKRILEVSNQPAVRAPGSPLTLCVSIPQGKYMVCPDYLSRQSELNERMRAILVDWLIEVHAQFKLIDETLFMAVHLMDRFLEKRRIKRAQLQLVGIAAMLIASKYEEIYAPEIHDFVYIADRAYAPDEIVRMESIILNELCFKITMPSTLHFVQRYAQIATTSA